MQWLKNVSEDIEKAFVFIGIAIILVVANVYHDHVNAPAGITVLPLLYPVLAILLVWPRYKLKIHFRILILYVLIGINDIGIRLWGGGMHDWEGYGWIFVFSLIGIIISILAIIAGIFIGKHHGPKTILWICLFVFVLYIHVLVFGSVGYGRSY